MPAAVFNRPIPNLETNIRVYGITCDDKAAYLLPEEILLIAKGEIRHVPYDQFNIATDFQQYVETEGHVYKDTEIVEQRWRYINRDGTPDKRFKNNEKLPYVRCGLLRLDVGGAGMQVMTSNPEVPAVFKKQMDEARAALGEVARKK
jgi:hypothetical protein